MTDLRKSNDRDEAVLAQIEREGGFSFTWLVSNRDHAASLHRLVASGRARFGRDWIPCVSDSPEPIPPKREPRPTVRELLRDWAQRAKVWLVGRQEEDE